MIVPSGKILLNIGVESVVQAAPVSGVSAEIPASLIYKAVGEKSLIKGFPGDSRSPATQMSYSLPVATWTPSICFDSASFSLFPHMLAGSHPS